MGLNLSFLSFMLRGLMGRRGASKRLVLASLSEGEAMSHRDFVEKSGLSDAAVWSVLYFFIFLHPTGISSVFQV